MHSESVILRLNFIRGRFNKAKILVEIGKLETSGLSTKVLKSSCFIVFTRACISRYDYKRVSYSIS